jgi:hypothetical protein
VNSMPSLNESRVIAHSKQPPFAPTGRNFASFSDLFLRVTEGRMNSDRALFKRILCQFLFGSGLGVLLSIALLLSNARQLFELITNGPSPYILLCIFVCGPSMYIGFGAAVTGFLFVVAENKG